MPLFKALRPWPLARRRPDRQSKLSWMQAAGSVRGRAWLTTKLVVLGLFAFWIALVIYPGPLFAYSVRRQNLELHARQPLPQQAGTIVDEALRRLKRSPFYRPDRKYDVFLCGGSAMFAFFTLQTRVTAVTHVGGNSFIRAANVAQDRVVDPSGQERQGERTLTYYIGHEATHAMTMAALGRLRFYSLAAFQIEGYADHVAFDREVDLPAGRLALRRQEPDMNVRQTGLYRRYELLVAYLLRRQGFTPGSLLSRRLDQAEVERSLLADAGL